MKERKTYLLNNRDCFTKINSTCSNLLSPVFSKDVTSLYNKYEKISQSNTPKRREDYQPQSQMMFTKNRNINKRNNKFTIQKESKYNLNDLINHQWKEDQSQPQFSYQNQNRQIVKKSSMDSLVLPKNKMRNNYSHNQAQVKPNGHIGYKEINITMVQSLWRGIMLRKQFVEQLTIYYRNRDFLKITIRLIMICLYDVFQLLKNINVKKPLMLKKTDCFKSNILQMSYIYQKRKDSTTNNTDSTQLNERGSDEQSQNESTKKSKKKIILKNKPNQIKEIIRKSNENNVKDKSHFYSKSDRNTNMIKSQDIIQSEKEFTIEAIYPNTKMNQKPPLIIASFTLELESSQQIKTNTEVLNELIIQIEKVNMLDIIQSKIHQFDLDNFNQETSNIISYVPLPIIANKDDNNNVLSINQFSESFLVIKNKPDVESKSLHFKVNVAYSYSYMGKIKKLPIKIEQDTLNKSNKDISNRTLLSKRFNKFMNDDLIEYSSHRKDNKNEVTFYFNDIINYHTYNITSDGFDLICDKATSDDFIIQNRINYFKLNESIFTRNLKPNERKCRSITSFNVAYLKNKTNVFRITNSSGSNEIQLTLSFSITCPNEDILKYPTFTSVVVSQRGDKTKSRLTRTIKNNKVIIANMLYIVIIKVVRIYTLSTLYYKLIINRNLMINIIQRKEKKNMSYHFVKWNLKGIKTKIVQDIQEKKRVEHHNFSINRSEYSIIGMKNAIKLTKKNINQLLHSQECSRQDKNEMICLSERKLIPKTFFINLIPNFDFSFQILKSNINPIHYSHRNVNIKSLLSLNKSLYYYDDIGNSSQIKKAVGTMNHDLLFSKITKLCRIIPKISYKAINILYKRFVKWRIYASSRSKFFLTLQPVILKQLSKICSQAEIRRKIMSLNPVFSYWKNTRKFLRKNTQEITFRTKGISHDILLIEFSNRITKFIKNYFLKKLSATYQLKENISEISKISSLNFSFSSSNKCFSPEQSVRMKNLLINDEDGQERVLRIKKVRNSAKNGTFKVAFSQDNLKLKRTKQMKIKIVKNPEIIPPRLSLPINKLCLISKEKLQLKRVIRELKYKARDMINEKKRNELLKIVNTYYTNYFRLNSTFSNLEVYYRKWLFVNKILFLKERKSFLKDFLIRLHKSKELKHYFYLWKILKTDGKTEVANNLLLSRKRYSQSLSLYICLNQWKYINNAQVHNKKQILNGYSKLALFFTRHYKIKFVFCLKSY